MECKVTNLVYWNEKIQIQEISPDNKCIISKNNIPKNTVLIVEQVFCDNSKDNSAKYILDAIRFDSNLYDSLYPRNEKWNIEDILFSLKHNNLILDKIKYNAFSINSNIYIGEYVTKSNHSQDCNAKAFLFDLKDEKESYPLSYIAIISTKDIEKDKHLLIKYNDKVIFEKNGNLSTAENIFEITDNLKQETLYKIRDYQDTGGFYSCRTNQLGVYYGAFCYEESIFFNDRFEKYMKELNIENTLENRRLWFETIYQKYNKII